MVERKGIKKAQRERLTCEERERERETKGRETRTLSKS